MILALDIGNTNIEIGILKSNGTSFSNVESFRIFTRIETTGDELGLIILNYMNLRKIDTDKISGLIFSSVVPPMDRVVIEMFKRFFGKKVIKVDENTKYTIKNNYKNPREVGSDRLVNAEAVFRLYKKNAIIVDMGTATTLCVLDDKGNYFGGAIIPGIFISTQSLTNKASRLPSINIQKKDKLLTNDTASAIEAGVYFSNYYAIQGMIKKMAEEIGFESYLKIATGGYSRIYEDCDLFDILDYDLCLKGLSLLWDNQEK